ncbi:MAG: acetyltransferase [Chitinophagaceae bacterium]|nr:MAG: acetyltransferase [Chitinophagaceae bacterium]
MNSMQKKGIIIVGYSGHSYVVIDAFRLAGYVIAGYCDNEEKTNNPYDLAYFGRESEAAEKIRDFGFFAAVGHNGIREKIHNSLRPTLGDAANAIHPSAIIDSTAVIGSGVLAAANVVINAQAWIGEGVICNTSSTIEHECLIGGFTHIAPGAVLCGNVKVGARSFIGANSVIAQGITIGSDVTIGAGSVILKDVPDNVTMIGNPGRQPT